MAAEVKRRRLNEEGDVGDAAVDAMMASDDSETQQQQEVDGEPDRERKVPGRRRLRVKTRRPEGYLDEAEQVNEDLD